MKVVNDGPLDAALYSAASVKVLYLLKQVNSTEGGWSLSQFVSEQVIDPTNGHVRAAFPVWLNLARWSYLAQQHGAPHFQDLSAHSRELSEALKSSAVVNLMNELGTATTDPQALLNGARQHRSGWLRQIEELSPKFIICGGTFWVLEQLDALPQTPVMTGPAGMRYSWSGAGPIYLDFVHPANRSSHAMMFAWLRETLLTLSKEIGTGGNRVS